MIYAIQNAFPKELIYEVKERMANTDATSSFNGSYNRSGKTVNISKSQDFKDLDSKINSFVTGFCASVLAPKFKPIFPVADTGYEYHKYLVGDRCSIHADNEIAFKPGENNSLIRFATMVVHLNTVEDGGEIIFPEQEKTIKTIEGQIVLFPPYSTYPHYVTSSKQEREILMTWFVYNGINAIRT